MKGRIPRGMPALVALTGARSSHKMAGTPVHESSCMKKFLALLTLSAASTCALAAPAVMTAEQKALTERISAASLRGHLSFIASDLLEGRGTPSRGQELAAEYIAAQYRRMGLEPVGDDGYFQTANWSY